MVDSLKNQKKLVRNDSKNFFEQKIDQNSKKEFFVNQKMTFLSKKHQKFNKTEFA